MRTQLQQRWRVLRPLVSNSAGLTLVEVIMAVSLTLTGLVALLAVIPLAVGHVGQANFKTQASFLAQARVENVKNRPWTDVPIPGDCLGVSADPDVDQPVTAAWASPPCSGPAPAGLVTFADEDYTTIAGYPLHRREVRVRDCGVAPGCEGVVDANLRQVTVAVFFQPQTGIGTIAAGEDVVKLTTLVAKRL
ncbi:MAG: type IV pilus modification PilV family protein [Candidatus Rokuibacteriota bacterium]